MNSESKHEAMRQKMSWGPIAMLFLAPLGVVLLVTFFFTLLPLISIFQFVRFFVDRRFRDSLVRTTADGVHAFFHKGHTWARPEGETLVLGPDGFARALVTGKIREIELSSPGKDVSNGEPVWKVKLGDRTLEQQAPVAGTVVSRDVVVGQAVAGAAELFEVADLSELVVRFAVRTGDLAGLREGAAVAVRSPELGLEGQARLSLLSPLVSRATRTVEVIASLPNAEGAWRPGLGVTVEVRAIPRRVALAVPRVAVHESAGKSLVFVRRSAGVFEARNVESGLADGERVEIRSGLEPGAEVAARNSLVLKSAWLTGGGE